MGVNSFSFLLGQDDLERALKDMHSLEAKSKATGVAEERYFQVSVELFPDGTGYIASGLTCKVIRVRPKTDPISEELPAIK